VEKAKQRVNLLKTWLGKFTALLGNRDKSLSAQFLEKTTTTKKALIYSKTLYKDIDIQNGFM